MSGGWARLDLLTALAAGGLVGAAVWATYDPLLAIVAGIATVAVTSLAATCFRLSRIVNQHASPLDAVETRRETPVLQPRGEDAPASSAGAATNELLAKWDDQSLLWEAAHRATVEFRRGLVAELAASFTDLQTRLAHLTAGLDELTNVDILGDLVSDDSEESGTAASIVASQLYAMRKDIVGLKHEVRGIPRSADFLHQVEAIVTLRGMIDDAPLPLPLSGGWRASPTTLLRYLELMTDQTQLVVECGSGVSSVWAGHWLRQLDVGRCISLEHDPDFLSESREMVRAHGLDDWVEVRFAPLSEGPSPWYDRGAIADLSDIDVLLVDGPPGPTAPQARAPALGALGPRMRVGGHILVDDADREEEVAVIEGWLATGLVKVVETSTDYKGWTVLRYEGPGER